MPDTTLNLTHPHAGQGPEPFTIDRTGADADDWFVLAVTVDDETAARWARAQELWDGVQDEMERAFKAAKKIIDDREAAEEAEARRLDAIEAAKEKARVDAIEAELTEKHGPREWAIVEKRQSHRRRRDSKTRTIHNINCGTFRRLDEGFIDGSRTSILRERLRMPEAIEELNPRHDPYYGEIHSHACGHCGAPLLEAAKAATLAAGKVSTNA